MKHFRPISCFTFITAMLIILTGCSTSAKMTSADLAILKNIPSDQSKQIDEVFRKAKFSFKVPTNLPFAVSDARADISSISMSTSAQQVELTFLANNKRFIQVVAMNGETPLSAIETSNKQKTKLSDGTEALYGNNGATSQLFWSKDGVTYSLLSGKDDGNKKTVSDLSMDALIKIADSFK
jgi:hypothetical protein